VTEAKLKQGLPEILPLLLFCCRIAEADQMNVIDMKDDDATF
jgi:hypothetical protein